MASPPIPLSSTHTNILFPLPTVRNKLQGYAKQGFLRKKKCAENSAQCVEYAVEI